jgi:hypothetical protein
MLTSTTVTAKLFLHSGFDLHLVCPGRYLKGVLAGFLKDCTFFRDGGLDQDLIDIHLFFLFLCVGLALAG